MPHVVVLGSGFTGLSVAHKLLKHTLPKTPDLKVTLVSPSHYTYWNIAAVRGLIPGQLSDEQLFIDFLPGFASYKTGAFEYIEGKATAVDPESNSVAVTTNSGEQKQLTYDHLVVATGSSETGGLPFKTLDSYQQTLDELHKLQDKVESAKTIVIGGAGPTGVEIAGELSNIYTGTKAKNVILVSSSDSVLPGLSNSVRKAATNTLTKAGVTVKTSGRATEADGVITITYSSGGQTAETFADALFLPVFGTRVNSSFLPDSLLDSNKNLDLKTTLQSAKAANIWGAGDIGNLESKQAARIDGQVAHLFGNMDLAIAGKTTFKEFKASQSTMVFVSIGKSAGTGQVGSMRMWSWLVSMAKSKTLFIGSAQGLASGKTGVSASL
ncbi:hypothetical protein BROUX41_004402 [Berkeleyomyces rouxiae]|uniref:uncharacterized protein n=1 Tax=Berkeleyomyces rouxiae TaxID=2035830 RepID=UPI003B7C4A3A